MSIKNRLIFAILAFVALFFTNVVLINRWEVKADSAAKSINIAGRQRMLTQKIAKEASMVHSGLPIQEDLNKTQALFDASHKALVQGREDWGILKVEDAEVLAQLQKVEALWQQYKTQLNNLGRGTAELDEINRMSLSLLKETNQTVTLLEKQAVSGGVSLSTIINIEFALSLLLSAFIFWYLKVHIIERIEKIKNISRDIVSSKQINRQLDISGDDEIAEAAQAFNSMLETLRSMTGDLKHIERELQQQMEVLTVTTSENLNSINLQRQEISMISSAVTEMVGSVQEVERNTKEAASIAQATVTQAADGSELLERSRKHTHVVASDIKEAANNIEQLAQASNAIGGIADTISTIAEQTNLLALNAAIEAARAGEQGRGFAVVADEVRTLAQRTQEATSEIHRMIQTLQDTTKVAVSTMEHSRTTSSEGVEQAERMAQQLSSIINAVKSLGSINQQIAVATQQQSTVAEEINKNIVTIEAKAENTFENFSVTAGYMKKLGDMSSRLHANLAQFQ
ncbi:Methyl-accepting chemotaxis protein McpH [Thalassocella blandensis]|nr:Methyl-accepting chemotaxis protein McpH [Thalassocella blandensis]